VKNEINPTFNLYYILDMGKNHNKTLPLAIQYLPYLGTSKYSAAQLQQEFYKLGLSFDVFSSADRMYVTLSGLEESLTDGVKLFEHILANVEPDEAALEKMIAGILKEREDAKSDKRTIFWSNLYNYGKYGETSPSLNILSEEELKQLKSADLVRMIKEVTMYKHYVFYYGQKSAKAVDKILCKYHKTLKNSQLKDYPQRKNYVEQDTDKNRVLFVNYDMVQAQISMISKKDVYASEKAPYGKVFGEYFGSGLSSIVFQEIREARALAYSAFAGYTTPSRAEDAHYVRAFMAVQGDKMPDAISAMQELLNEMPKEEKQFDGARVSVLKQIESERITKTRKFFTYLRAKDKGLDYDLRKDIYEKAQTINVDEMEKFFNENIKGSQYTYTIIGNKETLDMDYLKSLGEFKEVTLEEIFGY